MFHITTREARAGHFSGSVYTLADQAESVQVEVWPFLGMNCLRWQVRNPDGSWGNLLYAAPDWEANPVPTRSGHPVLFPFPNRLKDGRFTFAGHTYQLPRNESTGKHAIHGFTPYNPWRVVGLEATSDSASLTGQFQSSKDLPEALAYWPADFCITLTYRLTAQNLRVDALVQNPSTTPLPFGIGYHPYFCLPTAPDAAVDDMILQTTANSLWVAEASLATGDKTPIPHEIDFRQPHLIGGVTLDHLFGDIPFQNTGSLEPVAWLSHRSAPGRLTVSCDSAFRELLLFTPLHRKALAIEPYTCTTDAANFSDRGIDSGWRTLSGGDQFRSSVEYSWQPV